MSRSGVLQKSHPSVSSPVAIERQKLYIALSYCSFLKGGEKLMLSRTLEGMHELTSCSIDELSKKVSRYIRTKIYKPAALVQAVERALALMEYCKISFVFYDDEEFPPLLKEIPDAPFLLYYRGVLPNPRIPAVAIVGTRRPTGDGMKAALALGTECGHAGIPVVSGLARGIDTFAHRGALEGGGVTTAVLACGLDQLYPRSNAQLAAHILERGGCIISEYAPTEPPVPYRFPQRNRLISGLAHATVVVEAPEKSGALITADFALEQGRDVCIYGSMQESVQNAGGKRLAAEGAIPIEHASDLLREWADPSLQYVPDSENTRDAP